MELSEILQTERGARFYRGDLFFRPSLADRGGPNSHCSTDAVDNLDKLAGEGRQTRDAALARLVAAYGL